MMLTRFLAVAVAFVGSSVAASVDVSEAVVGASHTDYQSSMMHKHHVPIKLDLERWADVVSPQRSLYASMEKEANRTMGLFYKGGSPPSGSPPSPPPSAMATSIANATFANATSLALAAFVFCGEHAQSITIHKCMESSAAAAPRATGRSHTRSEDSPSSKVPGKAVRRDQSCRCSICGDIMMNRKGFASHVSKDLYGYCQGAEPIAVDLDFEAGERASKALSADVGSRAWRDETSSMLISRYGNWL
jgi:hypothetical protein